MNARIEYNLPKNYKDFLLNKKTYLIKSNSDVRKSIPIV